VLRTGGLKGALSVAAVAMVLIATGCGSSSDSASKQSTTTGASGTGSATSSSVAATAKTLTILVTNDDGVSAPGIDALVNGLAALPNTSLEVSAPSNDMSGTGGKTTPGTLVAHTATTASGHPAHSVDGYPADSVIWALDDHGVPTKPDVVMSGTNAGQNLGPIVDFSGTVGAARAGAARGIPAIAISTGGGNPMDFQGTVKVALGWLAQHRAALLAHTEPVAVTNLNVPTCTKGTPRGPVTVPSATTAGTRSVVDGAGVDCTQSVANPPNDVEAFFDGFAVFANIPITSSH
jgi:5'-nucleotidase